MIGIFVRRGDEDVDTQAGKTVWRHREMAIHMPKREPSEETSPTDTLISDF